MRHQSVNPGGGDSSVSPARKRRILMTTSVFPLSDSDATPAFVRTLAVGMVADGWDVRVLAPHAPGAARREITEGVKVYRYQYAFREGRQLLCYNGGMLINLRQRPWTRRLLPGFMISQLAALLWHTLRWRPDVIHSHSLLPQGLVAAVVAALSGTAHVSTSHGNDVFGLRPDGAAGILKRFVLAAAQAITVNSSATRKAVEALGCNVSKIHYIPAMPNTWQADKAIVGHIRDSVIAGQRLCLLFVGRLIEEKGVADLIHALPVLSARFPDVILLMVGDGQDRLRFQELAVSCGVDTRIHWAGWVPPQQVSSWMAAAYLLIVPSRDGGTGWKEAQGLVIIEAMLAGTPVVASSSGGIPDMIEAGVTGWLFTPGDVQGLVEMVTTVATRPEVGTVVAQARQRAAKQFSPAAVIRATTRLMDRIVRMH
jgi:glycosyltransferase involved in cell wall biosynthesis